MKPYSFRMESGVCYGISQAAQVPHIDQPHRDLPSYSSLQESQMLSLLLHGELTFLIQSPSLQAVVHTQGFYKDVGQHCGGSQKTGSFCPPIPRQSSDPGKIQGTGAWAHSSYCQMPGVLWLPCEIQKSSLMPIQLLKYLGVVIYQIGFLFSFWTTR